jgi:hypothetical protein
MTIDGAKLGDGFGAILGNEAKLKGGIGAKL